MTGESIEILLIEDNPADIRLFQEALKEYDRPCHLLVLTDDGEALAFLHKDSPYAHAPQPALIVLDLGLPRTSGGEVFTVLRSLPAYQAVPVLICSSLEETKGKARGLQLGATAYVPKPFDAGDFFAAVKAMVDKWCPRQSPSIT